MTFFRLADLMAFMGKRYVTGIINPGKNMEIKYKFLQFMYCFLK
jgi:hypothetical protein